MIRYCAVEELLLGLDACWEADGSARTEYELGEEWFVSNTGNAVCADGELGGKLVSSLFKFDGPDALLGSDMYTPT
jgi:hypothetical protein